MKTYYQIRDAKNLAVVEKLCESLPALCTEYFDDLLIGRAPSTLANYARQLFTFFEYMECETPVFSTMKAFTLGTVHMLTTDDIVSFMCFLKTKGVSDATILSYLRTLSAFFAHFIRKRKLLSNPVEGVVRPKKKKTLKIYLDAIDIKRFEYAVNDGTGLSDRVAKYQISIRSQERDMAIFALFLDTGVRVSELIGLDLDDVDLVRCRITVRRKGGDIDAVYFSDDTLTMLNDYLFVRKQIAMPDCSALFVAFIGVNKGQRLSVRTVELMVKKYASAAGVTNSGKMTPHKMRHTCAMALLKTTGNIALVQKQLGHRSITSTTVYAEADDSDLESIRNRKK